MRKLITRIIVALLTFLLGIAATTVCFFSRQSQEVRIIVPDASWEPIFFRSINSAASLTGQNDLRKTILAEGDVEIRVWRGFGLLPLEGVTLRAVAGRWSAIYVRADNYYELEGVDRSELRPPKSEWRMVWQRLVNAGILTLPDASELNCNVGGLDGGAYVVEISRGNIYRTYMYDMPSEAKCSEARQMLEIWDIIFKEFSLKEYPQVEPDALFAKGGTKTWLSAKCAATITTCLSRS